MGHWYNPPNPFTGGRQPLDNKDLPPSLEIVPNPPFRNATRTAAVLAIVVAAAQLDPWQYNFEGGQQPGA